MKTFLQIRHLLQEMVGRTRPAFPPTILLRRIAIRIFPNGRQVATYKDTLTGETYAVPPIQG
jgi:hypothetical protein